RPARLARPRAAHRRALPVWRGLPWRTRRDVHSRLQRGLRGPRSGLIALMAREPASTSRQERTRTALREAALARFIRDGFEQTSIADLAADAGVTPRTFYRYFASKDEVLFADYEARLDWFRRALSVRPRKEPLVESVLAAVDSFPDDPAVVSEIARIRA